MSGSCIIVGMGPGLGLALAERFGTAGHAIGMVARREGELLAAEARLAAEGITAKGAPADAGDEEGLRTAIRLLAEALGPVEVLIYNAAVLQPGEPSALTSERVLADFRVNVLGALVAAQAVAPSMIEARRGTILVAGGGFALQPIPLFASLGLGKAALRNLVISLAGEYGPQGINVATVTICGRIADATPFSPSAIADAYWSLHARGVGEQTEVQFRG
jgi:short-subunit dehydrogenase